VTKALLGFLAAMIIAIAAARVAYNVSSDTGEPPVQEAWAQDRIEFVTWNDEKWTAWVHDGAFELIPENSRSWSRHANPSIAFTDWQGESWQAKIDGNTFLLAEQGNWQGEVDRAHTIRYRDWNGNNQLRTVADLQR